MALTEAPSGTRPFGSEDAAVRAAAAVAEVAAEEATTVDREAAFPHRSVAALADAGLLGAVAPVSAGGAGLEIGALARIAGTLAHGCGSSAMIWAMHQLQLACVVRHGGLESPALSGLLSGALAGDLLIASVTSEKGIGGDISRSHAAIEGTGGARTLAKDAPTVSYARHAGLFLITARRSPGAAEDDQVAALVRRDQVVLDPAGSWNPMGMRGTCSPGFRLRAAFDEGQILPESFGAVAARTLIPLSEILWSAIWIGLADEALDRAARFVTTRAAGAGRRFTDPRMGWADQSMLGLQAQLGDAVAAFSAVQSGERPGDRAFRHRMNALKLAASTVTIGVAQQALALCGFAGYQEDGPYSVTRMLRDLYSAQIMVSNDRLVEINAANAAQMRSAVPGGAAR